MLEKLTPEQELIPEQVRDEWIAHGLSTAPADRVTAEEGARATYVAVDLVPPDLIVWCDSPLAGARQAAVFATGRDKPSPSDVRTQLSSAIYGQHDAGWLAWCDCWRRLGVEIPDTTGFEKVGRSAGWWWAFDEAIVLTDRPELLLRDGENRLHAEDGPAMRYRDGWSVYAWHGVRVPRWVIDNDRPAREILDEDNQEIRRAAIEVRGWGEFLDELGAVPVDTCPDPGNPGQTLRLYDIGSDVLEDVEDGVRLLVVSNGTVERDGRRRTFGLSVPASMTSALEAAAFTYSMTAEEYAELEVRT